MVSETVIREFKQIVDQENVFSDITDRVTYSYDAAVVKPILPAVALRPASGEALSRDIPQANR